jgi:DNA repair exonuclease SbcCD ATPase subunit
MMNDKELEIQTIIHSDFISVKFPFELKDSFKETFRTARWHPYNREWRVKDSTISSNKLKKWIAEVEKSGALEEIKELDEEVMTNKHFKRLTENLQELKEEIEERKEILSNSYAEGQSVDSLIEELDETKKLIVELKEKKKNALKNLKKKASLKKDAKTALLEEINECVNIGNIAHCHNEMCRSKGPRGQRSTFDAAVKEISKAFEDLNEIGIFVENLEILADANYNRSQPGDRDDPNKIQDIWDIIRIDQE